MSNARQNGHQINNAPLARHLEQCPDFIISVSATPAHFPAACFGLLHHQQRIDRNAPLFCHPIEKTSHARQIFIQCLGGFLVFAPPFHKRVGRHILRQLPAAFGHQQRHPVFKFCDVLPVPAFGLQICDKVFQVL